MAKVYNPSTQEVWVEETEIQSHSLYTTSSRPALVIWNRVSKTKQNWKKNPNPLKPTPQINDRICCSLKSYHCEIPGHVTRRGKRCSDLLLKLVKLKETFCSPLCSVLCVIDCQWSQMPQTIVLWGKSLPGAHLYRKHPFRERMNHSYWWWVWCPGCI